MDQVFLTIKSNDRLAEGIYRMVLSGDCTAFRGPGQFLNVKLDGYYLRRPISVCDLSDDRSEVTIIYKVLGRGTADMTKLQPGQTLDVLTGLGNGFSTAEAGDRPLLIAGGVGLPPMYLLAKKLIAEGRQPVLAAGFNTAEEAFYLQEFRELGVICSDRKKQDASLQDPLHQGTFMDVRIATLDGSLGVKGFVTDALPADYTYFYCCGPMPMLKAVYKATKTSGQFSLEERMGCGFGACMGCSIETASGPKRVCKDGPVFLKEELPWELR